MNKTLAINYDTKTVKLPDAVLSAGHAAQEVLKHVELFIRGGLTENDIETIDICHDNFKTAVTAVRDLIGKQISRARSIYSSNKHLNSTTPNGAEANGTVDLRAHADKVSEEIMNLLRSNVAYQYNTKQTFREEHLPNFSMEYRGYNILVALGNYPTSKDRIVYATRGDGGFTVYYQKVSDIKAVFDQINMLTEMREKFPTQEKGYKTTVVPVIVPAGAMNQMFGRRSKKDGGKHAQRSR
jgi:hypothetical protein